MKQTELDGKGRDEKESKRHRTVETKLRRQYCKGSFDQIGLA